MDNLKHSGREFPSYYRRGLLNLLVERSAKFGTFTLASGKTSNFFVDVKKTALTARGILLITHGLESLLSDQMKPEGDEPYGVAGVTMGGCPLATAYSLTFGIDSLYVRKAVKDHGTKAKIEGTLPDGSVVILLEDVITTGGSSLDAVRTLREAGYKVPYVLAVVDREEGGAEAIEAEDVKLLALYRKQEFLEVLAKSMVQPVRT